jgi:hypothetical protein
MKTIRTRLTALEARLGGDEQARLQRQIRAMSDDELEAEIAAYEAADAHLSDDELRAAFEAAGFSGDDLALLMARRTNPRGNEGRS